jgi:hypothetical protein
MTYVLIPLAFACLASSAYLEDRAHRSTHRTDAWLQQQGLDELTQAQTLAPIEDTARNDSRRAGILLAAGLVCVALLVAL